MWQLGSLVQMVEGLAGSAALGHVMTRVRNAVIARWKVSHVCLTPSAASESAIKTVAPVQAALLWINHVIPFPTPLTTAASTPRPSSSATRPRKSASTAPAMVASAQAVQSAAATAATMATPVARRNSCISRASAQQKNCASAIGQ